MHGATTLEKYWWEFPPFIDLKDTSMFNEIEPEQFYSLDYGGSLAKIVYASRDSKQQSVTDGSLVRLNLKRFQKIGDCLDFLKKQMQPLKHGSPTNFLVASGGAAFQNADFISDVLCTKVDLFGEMEAIVKGCNFILQKIDDGSWTYHHEAPADQRYQFATLQSSSIFPYLLVNIGTGISVMKVESETVYSRIGGSTLGGGAFMGLGSLLVGVHSFEELMAFAEKGDHRSADLMVSDVYAGPYDESALPADLIAASFGRCVSQPLTNENQNKALPMEKADVMKSLLLMLSNSIGQMAMLYAQVHKLSRIYFGGSFVSPTMMRTISFAVKYWSKGEVEALFLRHSSYIGAIGAFMQNVEKYKHGENVSVEGKES
ncbi:hypothetical protein AB6A40_000233 [Gnathostoma spinigerum]|uniref:Pantothenate kinase n=1 Tax=Gnathostoma spinigerum TaxID=75299 RepID=A0ABD6E5Y8_9BILA